MKREADKAQPARIETSDGTGADSASGQVLQSKEETAQRRSDLLYSESVPLDIQRGIRHAPSSLSKDEWKSLVWSAIAHVDDNLSGVISGYVKGYDGAKELREDCWLVVYDSVVHAQYSVKSLSAAYLMTSFRRELYKKKKLIEKVREALGRLIRHTDHVGQLSDSDAKSLAPLFQLWRTSVIGDFERRKAKWHEHWIPFVLYWLPRLDRSSTATIIGYPVTEDSIAMIELRLLEDVQLLTINRTAEELLLDVSSPDFALTWYRNIWSIREPLECEVASLRTDDLQDMKFRTKMLDVCFSGRTGTTIDKKVNDLKPLLEHVTTEYFSK